MNQETAKKLKCIALLGNPNAGKTTIFNALTGLRHTTANYAGVTVEKKMGRLSLDDRETIDILDLPGTYSLIPRSLDEQIVHDVLIGAQPGTPRPDALLFVLDANNLERNLYLAFQVLELRIPTVFALNMSDLAKANGKSIDIDALEQLTSVPCIETVGNKRIGISEIKKALSGILQGQDVSGRSELYLNIPPDVKNSARAIAAKLSEKVGIEQPALTGEALRMITRKEDESPLLQREDIREKIHGDIVRARESFQKNGADWHTIEVTGRYRFIDSVCSKIIHRERNAAPSMSEKIDKVLTHRFWGLLIFVGVMGTIFQMIFSWATIPMDLISDIVTGCGRIAGNILPDGQLESLIVDGIIAGVGNVVIFLPQIFILFFFIAFFEDLGYMARAAFVLDRIMKKVGLNGRAFLPLLSSFACAIPGVMAARTIKNRNDRLATILVAPLMSCSARLPVYTLMIGAFIPSVSLWGIFNLKSLTLLSMYLLSIVMGLGMAALFRNTFLKGGKTPFVFEMPPYRIPNLGNVIVATWERGKEFLFRAGSIILAISIILWFLASYPKNPDLTQEFDLKRQETQALYSGEELDKRLSAIDAQVSGEMIRTSFAGKLGKFIEPVIKPLGFDWKIGIGLIASFAAREVLVSTLAIVYNVSGESDETSPDLIQTLREAKSDTGDHLFTPLVAVSLMVFFVLACQCMSTVAIVRRETGGWLWPIFMVSYMTVLAWCGAFVTYQGGRLLGFE